MIPQLLGLAIAGYLLGSFPLYVFSFKRHLNFHKAKLSPSASILGL